MSGSGLFSRERPAKPHLTRGGGMGGEVADLRGDVARVLAPLAAITVEEFTDVAAADTDAILLAKASVEDVTVYEADDLDGALGPGLMSPPRNVTVTTAGETAANAPATLLVEGVDIDGNVISEELSVGQTATTVAGDKAFARVTRLTFSAADGDEATLAVGFGVKIGLSKPIKARAGLTGALREIAAGSVVTNGTFAGPATGAPHGTYAPNSAPNGTNDYAVYYEYDAS